MRYKEERTRITIEPTNDIEIAYIEEVFGLKKDGDKIELVRKNAMGLSCIAYLETKVPPPVKDRAEAWKPRTIAEFLDNTSMPDDSTKILESFAYKMHANIKNVPVEDRNLLEASLVAAVRNQNYVLVANLAMLLAQPD